MILNMENNFTSQKLVVDIDLIAPNPLNPNYMTPSQFSKLKAKIEKIGFVASIIVREYGNYYQILDGEHRWKVLKALGYTKAPIENMGPVPDNEVAFHTTQFNEGGQNDNFKLAELYSQMKDAGQTDLLSLLQHSDEEIENTIKLVDFDFSQYNKESELPTRNPGMLVVLPFNDQESYVWLKVKEELVTRGFIGTDNSKKKQDIATIMWLAKNILGIALGSNGSDTIQFEVTPQAEMTMVNESVNIGTIE